MGMFIKIDGCLPNSSYREYSFTLWQGIINCPPNGGYWLTAYTQSATSSIVGPVEQASVSGLLRATLPMEVVMVSRYVMAVTSSFTMWLALILEILGVTISLMGMVPMGASRSTSTSSGICKQAVTPKKPCARVGGCTSASTWDGKEGLGRVAVPSGEAGGLIGIIWESWQDPTFGLEASVGWGISPAATTC